MSCTKTSVGVTGRQTRDNAAPPWPKARLRSFWRRAMAVNLCLLGAALLVAIAPFAAESAGDIKFPAEYRSWFHVNTLIIDKASPLFEAIGGMHNVYLNSSGQAALKKGAPYPDKSVFVSDVHEFTVSDGSYVEGARKGLGIMVKDQKKYASTGGWGFQLWAGGDPKKPIVTDPAKQCFECHQPKKDQDYVYSTYIP
jgi:agmatine/peptidylarginine deiminase